MIQTPYFPARLSWFAFFSKEPERDMIHSRAEFIEALWQYNVSPFQQAADEILADADEAARG